MENVPFDSSGPVYDVYSEGTHYDSQGNKAMEVIVYTKGQRRFDIVFWIVWWLAGLTLEVIFFDPIGSWHHIVIFMQSLGLAYVIQSLSWKRRG